MNRYLLLYLGLLFLILLFRPPLGVDGYFWLMGMTTESYPPLFHAFATLPIPGKSVIFPFLLFIGTAFLLQKVGFELKIPNSDLIFLAIATCPIFAFRGLMFEDDFLGILFGLGGL
jgi:hypothetical protein